MRRRQEKKRTRKLGRKKLRRNRRFWERVTTTRYERILEIARHFTKNLSDAQDLVQIVIFRLLKYCPKPIRIINLDAYIFASVRNASRDSQRPRKEISLSDLPRKDVSQMAVLDPNITRFLETCDLKALETHTESTKLSHTKKLITAGYSLPEIASLLNEPVRRTRYRWYRYRQTQQKALRLIAKNIASSKIQ